MHTVQPPLGASGQGRVGSERGWPAKALVLRRGWEAKALSLWGGGGEEEAKVLLMRGGGVQNSLQLAPLAQSCVRPLSWLASCFNLHGKRMSSYLEIYMPISAVRRGNVALQVNMALCEPCQTGRHSGSTGWVGVGGPKTAPL